MKKTFLLLCVALTIGAVMMASCKKDNAAAEPTIVLTEGTFVDMGGSVLWCSRNLDRNLIILVLIILLLIIIQLSGGYIFKTDKHKLFCCS